MIYVCIRVGRWTFINGHLYRPTVSRSRRGAVCWITNRCLFCGKADYA